MLPDRFRPRNRPALNGFLRPSTGQSRPLNGFSSPDFQARIFKSGSQPRIHPPDSAPFHYYCFGFCGWPSPELCPELCPGCPLFAPAFPGFFSFFPSKINVTREPKRLYFV